MSRKSEPIEVRFWRYVRASDADSCWLWSGSKKEDGYGILRMSGCARKAIRAHRLSWEIAHGPIPDGMLVCHKCDNPPCVNPSHLFLGTNIDNSRDRDAKGRTDLRGLRTNLPTGERHSTARLTDEEIATIRRERAAGVAPGELARRFGTCRKYVWAIVNYKWRR